MKKWTLLIIGVTVLALAAGLFAQGAEPPKKPARLTQAWGAVKSVDADARTIVIVGRLKRDDEPKELTFAVTDKTKIIVPGNEGGPGHVGILAEVKPDAHVTILYSAAADGTLTALSVTLTDVATK